MSRPSPSIEFSWTPENTQKVVNLWKNGVSATTIGKMLGCSRNAVIGKVGRMGAFREGRQAPSPVQPRVRAVKVRQDPPMEPFRKDPPKPPPIKVQPPEPPPLGGITLVNVGNGCRFPLTAAGADTAYCGDQVDCSPYCAKHRAIMYAPSAKTDRKHRDKRHLAAVGYRV